MTARNDKPLVMAFALPALAEDLEAIGCSVVAWPTEASSRKTMLDIASGIKAVVTYGSLHLPEGLLDAAKSLGLIACLGAGYESYDPDDLRRRGISLVNSAGLNAIDVADLGMGLVLAVHRHIVQADAMVRSGQGRGPQGHRLAGRKMGILGLGAIGIAMAERAQAFGMEIAWWGPRPKDSPWQRFETPLELAQWADTVVVCCRPTPENDDLVNRTFLDALGAEGVLINVARGSIVDEDELILALREGRIAGAGLDVFKQEPPDPAKWRDVPRCTLHPHNGGGTFEALDDGRKSVVENVRRHLAGEPLLNLLN